MEEIKKMSVNDITLKLENYKKEYEEKKQAWEQVKRLYKKDGSEFANKQKNIDGASFGKYNPNEDWMHPYLTVYYGSRYQEESIPMFLYIDTLKKDDSRLSNKDQIKEDGCCCVRSTYIYNIDECFEAIQEHIKFLNDKIEDYKKQLAIVEEITQKADLIINQANELLKDERLSDGYYHNTLGYSIRDYIKNNLK